MRVIATELTGTIEVCASANILAFATSLIPTADLRQWDRPTQAGTVLLYTPGSEHRGTYFDHASYISLDVSAEQVLAEAELAGIAVEPIDIDTARLLRGTLDPAVIHWLSLATRALHGGVLLPMPPGQHLEAAMLAAFVRLVPRQGRPPGRLCEAHAAQIVRRARAYIEAALSEPIAVDAICKAAGCSRSALHRAFRICLGESPRTYVLMLRLNRIREDLAAPDEAMRTVTTVSHRWGIAELGRLADRYRAQFGELPSATLARRQVSNRPAPTQH